MKILVCLILFLHILNANAQRTIWPPIIGVEFQSTGLLINKNEAYFTSETQLENGDYTSEIVHTSSGAYDNWDSISALNSEINSNPYNFVVGVSENADTIYLKGSTSNSNPNMKGLSFSSLVDGVWSAPKKIKMKGMTSKTPFYDLYVHPKGNWCLISLEKQRKQSDDIYISFKNKLEGYYEKPVPLGQNINTTASEITPFITEDGKYLFFSRTNSYGATNYDDSINYDIYMSQSMDTSLINWSTPLPLIGINTPGYEGNYWCCKDSFAFYTFISRETERKQIYTTLAPRALRHSDSYDDQMHVSRLRPLDNKRIELPALLNTYKVELPKTNSLIPRGSIQAEAPIYNIKAKIKIGDSLDASVSNILVEAKDAKGNKIAETRTDSAGSFTFENLPLNQKVFYSTPENTSSQVKVGLVDANGNEEEAVSISVFSDFIFQEIEKESAVIQLLDQLDESSLDKYWSGNLSEFIVHIDDEQKIELFLATKIIEGVILDSNESIIRCIDSLTAIDKNSQTIISVQVVSDSTFDLSSLDSVTRYSFSMNGNEINNPKIISLQEYLMISHNERPLTNETIFDLGLPVNQPNDLNAQGTDINNDVLSDPRASRSSNNLDVTIVNDSSSLHVVGGAEFKQTEQDSILMKQADEGSIAVVDNPMDNQEPVEVELTIDNAQGTDINNDVSADPRASRSSNNLDVTIVNDSSSLHVVGGAEFKQTEQDSILMKQADEGSIAAVDNPMDNQEPVDVELTIDNADPKLSSGTAYNDKLSALPRAIFKAPVDPLYGSSYDKFLNKDGSYAKIIQTEKGVNYHFDFNSIQITQSQISYIIKTIAPFYRESDKMLIILEGHTDDAGSEEVNDRVGILRASQVLYELERAGIEDVDLKIISRGETNPIAPNTSDEGRAMNRRVEIIYTQSAN